MDEIASSRLSADLTLVQSGIFELDRAQLQCPFARVTLVIDGEASVFSVDGPANAEDVQVSMAYPRHLHRPLEWWF